MAGAHREERAAAVARIAVLGAEGPGDVTRLPSGSPLGDSGSSESGTFLALGRLGAKVEILPAGNVDDCLRLSREPSLDLILLDCCPREVVEAFFSARPGQGAPVVVIIPADASESAALDAFRHGASDCVRVGGEYVEVLALVAMEQIQRWRGLREKEAARDKIEWLERLNQAIVTEIPVSLLVLDGHRRVVEWNPEFQRTFDCGPGEARGAEIRDVLPAPLIADGQLMELVPALGEPLPKRPRLARFTDAEGKDLVFDVRSQRLDAEGHLLLTLSNVTKTELMSRRLGELERFNEHVVQSINSALVVIDLEGRISYANPTAGQILKISEADLAGRPIGEFLSSTDKMPAVVEMALEKGVHSRGREMVLSLADGAAVPIGISCTPLLGDHDEIQGAVAIFQDLSEIKELQRQVLQQEKMASIGQLAAGIAHEINNPVGFIHANLAQMSEYLDDLGLYLDSVDELKRVVSAEASEEGARALRSLDDLARKIDLDYLRGDFGSALRESLEGSERIRHIVSDLRDFSHRGGVKKSSADINQCVDSTANIVWTMMKHSVELEKNYAELPELRCHPMQIKQVLMNLLVNAYQAIEENVEDGSATRGVIEITTRERDAGIEIAIRDTGAGIAESNLPRIFDPFYTTKEVGAGTGLGLSTSYGIVKQHGGEMTVSSELGQGACFRVWLPHDLDEASEPT
ncbi:MAG: ATP-binding protein [Myxococcota bacterium]|nr:ATP-binding protein [Myxococcota bacterium]